MARSKRICGLDLRKDQACIVQYSPDDDAVDSVAIKPVPEIAGDIWDILLEEVPGWIAETKLKGRDAVCAVPADRAVIKKLALDSNENDIGAALAWELSHHLSDPIESYSFDFQPVSGNQNGVQHFLAVAYRKAEIGRIAGVVRAARLNPVVMDVDLFALVNLFEANYRERLDEPSLLVHGDDHQLSCVLTRRGEFVDCESVLTPHGEPDDVFPAIAQLDATLRLANGDLMAGGALPLYLSGPFFAIPEITEAVQARFPGAEVLYPFKRITCKAPGMGEDDLRRYAPHLAIAVGLALRGSGD